MRRLQQRLSHTPWFLLVTFSIASVLLCSAGVAFSAKGKNSFKVAVVDPQAVIEKTKAGSRALAGLKEHQKLRENVLKNDQKDLERLQEELKQQEEKNIPEAELKRKQESFAKKFQDWQKRGQEYQMELSQKQKELVQEYMKKIEAVTSIVAKRHGFSLVVDKGSENTLKIVLYSRKGLDITSEVVKEFDRRYK